MLTPLSSYSDVVLLALRLILGSIMLYYGIPKLRNLKGNAKDLEKMGYKPGWLFGNLNVAIEFFGGLGIIFGVLAWIPALGFAGQMALGAIHKATKTNKPYSDWSYDLLLFALCLVILAFGTGAYSLMRAGY